MIQDKKIKIFIVDDELFCLHMYKQDIENLGYENITAFENGIDCVESLNKKPDVIFLDYKLGDMSGFEVLTKIKRFDPNIYVVMISGQDQIEPAVEALKHGAFDYIQKGDTTQARMKEVLDRIHEVKALIRKSKPGFLKSVFKFL